MIEYNIDTLSSLIHLLLTDRVSKRGRENELQGVNYALMGRDARGITMKPGNGLRCVWAGETDLEAARTRGPRSER